MEHHRHRSYGQLSIGIFLLFVGVAMLLTKFDVFSYGPIWHYWPLIFIAIGLGKLLDAQFGWEYRKAFWMLFMGGWFLISELHLFGLDYGNSWPILLIGAGIGMLWKSIYPSHHEMKEHCHGI
jgi:hypothetical protein